MNLYTSDLCDRRQCLHPIDLHVRRLVTANLHKRKQWGDSRHCMSLKELFANPDRCMVARMRQIAHVPIDTGAAQALLQIGVRRI